MNLLRQPAIRLMLAVALTATVGALLVATLFLTQFDPQWIAFLAGVLFAAVLALLSQASKAEWRLMRRSKQLERVREQLSQEIARSRNAAHGLQSAEKRTRLVNDRLPIPILYVDREERCHYHNPACADWLGLPAERISGQLLRDLFGAGRYPLIEPQVARTLSGETADYGLSWPDKHGRQATIQVRQIPYSPDDGEIIGFYLVMTRTSVEAAAGDGPADSSHNGLPGSGESSEAFYLRSITDELMTNVDARSRLLQALQQNEFLLFAQKILPLKPGVPEPECYEVLVRLKEEEDNLLPPGGFIPIAERYGMLEEIDRWVVRSLIAWCLDQHRRVPGWRVPLFCVNLSEASVVGLEFAQFVRHELTQREEFPARALCFEISETDVITSNDHVRRLIAALKPAGCRFSIDGFGGAKVSFSYLEAMAVDFLKIEGSIIQNILRDPSDLAKARAINTVCQKVGMRTVAEFVETREILDKLREIGVDYVQGFGIARPAPISELES